MDVDLRLRELQHVHVYERAFVRLKGATITLATLTSIEIDGRFHFADGTYQWQANFAAVVK
jgi:hypothetical protein